MTAPWIIQGKHLGKCPGEASAITKRGYVCAVSPFSRHSLHSVSESKCPVQPWATVDACLCLTSAVFCNGCAGPPPRRPADIFPSIPGEEVGMWPASQNTGQGKGELLATFENNKISF